MASLDMLPDFGQLRSVGGELREDIVLTMFHNVVLTMFQARHCPPLRQPQQHQERHCDVGGGDIVIKWSE